MPQSLKVIALISGGKDSLFSILHCLANGHEVVALANLYPPAAPYAEDAEGVDLNSFMYQTVGHSIIPLYEEALGIPLYRQEIRGTAVQNGREYAPASSDPKQAGDKDDEGKPEGHDVEEDETESLIPLLKKVIAHHPEANAISTGAILSTYQRTRVESVALRRNLTPLSYLWQYPYLPPYKQSQLLDDMAVVGQDSRIIKVASGGLDDGVLWQNVAERKTMMRLKKAMSRFGGGDGAVLGEGGEFETLAVDGPSRVWKKRVEVEMDGTVTGEGGNASVKFGKARTVDKDDEEKEKEGNALQRLRKPEIFDEKFNEVFNNLKDSRPESTSSELAGDSEELKRPSTKFLTDSVCSWRSRNYSYIFNITAPQSGHDASSQIKAITEALGPSFGVNPSTIVSCTLLLRSMSDFGKVNPIYGSIFTEPLPAARVAIACGDALAEGIYVMLSLITYTGDQTTSQSFDTNTTQWKRGLHVQSRSYWAPANIGPYSQAIASPIPSGEFSNDTPTQSPEWVHIAGQIPLTPSTMELESENFVHQAVLSLQHFYRIARTMNVVCSTGALAYIAAPKGKQWDNGERKWRVDVVRRVWLDTLKASFEEWKDEAEGNGSSDDEGDVWDRKYGMGSGGAAEADVDKDTRPPFPDWSRIDVPKSDESEIKKGTLYFPPCFVAEVDELPRGAAIEWVSSGIANANVEFGRDGVFIKETGTRFTWFEVQDEHKRPGPESLEAFGGSITSTVCTACELNEWWVQKLRPTIVPCRRVWGQEVEAKAIAMVKMVD